MFQFTSQERAALFVLVCVLFTGAVLHYAFARYPQLVDIVNLLDSDRLYPKADLNFATVEELIDIPYIGEYTARNIVEHRRAHGPFVSIEDVKKVKGIKEKNYERFRAYVCVK